MKIYNYKILEEVGSIENYAEKHSIQDPNGKKKSNACQYRTFFMICLKEYNLWETFHEHWVRKYF